MKVTVGSWLHKQWLNNGPLWPLASDDTLDSYVTYGELTGFNDINMHLEYIIFRRDADFNNIYS